MLSITSPSHFHARPVHREKPVRRDPQVLYHIYMLFLVVTTHILGDVLFILSFVINRLSLVRVAVRSNRFNGPFLIADEDLASVACGCTGLVIRIDH